MAHEIGNDPIVIQQRIVHIEKKDDLAFSHAIPPLGSASTHFSFHWILTDYVGCKPAGYVVERTLLLSARIADLTMKAGLDINKSFTALESMIKILLFLSLQMNSKNQEWRHSEHRC